MDSTLDVKSGFENRPVNEILNQPVSVLNGVTAVQEQALKAIGVTTVFDLAFSQIFRTADDILRSSQDPNEIFARHGAFPSGRLAPGSGPRPVVDLPRQQLSLLAGLDNAAVTTITSSLSIQTIRDLALWPPYQTAQRLVDQAYNQNAITSLDPAEELTPLFGEYATQVAYYKTLVMIDAPAEPTRKLESPLDILAGATGPTKPAIGARLTYKQTWTPQAITLGNLLNSVTLIPGETTKIAVIDWTRRTRTSSVEDITQSEELANTLNQSNSVDSVATSVANEMQAGASASLSASASATAAGAVGGAGGAAAGAGVGAISVTGSFATSVAASTGRKDITSTFGQDITNSTEQNARSERSKRAALVTEASQQEREQLTTRTLTNYNHMHTLNVLYFEVVELFQVVLGLERAERVLFVPMKTLRFDTPQVVERFRGGLLHAALNRDVRTWISGVAGEVVASMQLLRPTEISSLIEAETPAHHKSLALESAKEDSRIRTAFHQLQGFSVLPLDKKFTAWQMDGDSELINAGWDGTRIKSLEFQTTAGIRVMRSNAGINVAAPRVSSDLGAPVRLADIQELRLKFSTLNRPAIQRLQLYFRNSSGVSYRVPFDAVLAKDKEEATLARFDAEDTFQVLRNHLNDNALYYSQAIWRSLDQQTLVALLGPFTVKNKRLVDYLDTNPIAVNGNYLVFLFEDETDQTWIDWLATKIKKEFSQVRSIALPTGGVWAEGLLSRANSAEKIDLTRFWNWQDSPIPFAAPDIAALQAGQHTVESTQRAGSLDSPVVNIVNPQPIPIMDGLSAITSAITQGNMFRDMSGLAGTQGLAQAGLQATTQLTGSALNAATSLAGSFVPLAGGNGRGPGGRAIPGSPAAAAQNAAAAQAARTGAGGAANPVANGVERRLSPATENITHTAGMVNLGSEMDSPSDGGKGSPQGSLARAAFNSALPGSDREDATQTQPTNFLRVEEISPEEAAGLPPEFQGKLASISDAQARLSNLAASNLDPADYQAAAALTIKGLYNQAIKPLLQQAQADGSQIETAFRSMVGMEALIQEFDVTGVDAELTEAKALVKKAIGNAITTENAALANDGGLAHIQRIDTLLAASNVDSELMGDFGLGAGNRENLNASVNITLSASQALIGEGEVIDVVVKAEMTLGNQPAVPLAGGRVAMEIVGGAPGSIFGDTDASGQFTAQISLSSGPLIGGSLAGSDRIQVSAVVSSPQSALLGGVSQPLVIPGKLVVRFLGGQDPSAGTNAPLHPSPYGLPPGFEVFLTAEGKQGSMPLHNDRAKFRLAGTGTLDPTDAPFDHGEAQTLYSRPNTPLPVVTVSVTVDRDGQSASDSFDIALL